MIAWLLLGTLVLNAILTVLFIRDQFRIARHKRYIEYLYGRVIALAGDEQ